MSLNLVLMFISFLICISFFIYRLGKMSKENEIIKNNIKLKRDYENNRNHINSGKSLANKLKRGKF